MRVTASFLVNICGLAVKFGGTLASKLDNRDARKKLPAGVRFQERLALGQFLCYRRPVGGGAGAWYARLKSSWTDTLGSIGPADDAAAPVEAMSYRQARVQALKWCREHGALIDYRLMGNPTVADAISVYFSNQLRQGKKGATRAWASTRAWILPTLGHIAVSQLTRQTVEQWHESVATTPKRLRTRAGQPQQYAPPPITDDMKRARKDTANRILTTLKAALSFAAERGLADPNEMPWQRARAYPRTTSARARFLQPGEAVRLAAACEGDFGDLVRGALLTGCRYSELAHLTCSNYNPASSTLYIAESKNGKPRHVVLSPEGTTLFDRLVAKRSEPSSLIFSNSVVRVRRLEFDGAWSDADQVRRMKLASAAAGIEPVTFHELRHTYASMLVNAGCPLIFVAAQLGHSDTRMVERHYGHIKNDAMRAAIEAAMPVLGIVGRSGKRAG